ncbi:MAG: hypothetical protein ACLTJG_09825 [[Clostridium] innocuum]
MRKSIETDNNIDKTLHTEENGALEQEEPKEIRFIYLQKWISKRMGNIPGSGKERGAAEQPPVDDTFTNEYLMISLREVREYNISQGKRESDNTQADILNS